MPEPARPAEPRSEVETDMTRIYVLVVIVEIITLVALYIFQQVYS